MSDLRCLITRKKGILLGQYHVYNTVADSISWEKVRTGVSSKIPGVFAGLFVQPGPLLVVEGLGRLVLATCLAGRNVTMGEKA